MHELTQASQETKLLSGAERRDFSDYWEGRRSSSDKYNRNRFTMALDV